jgi:hypothetical protein
MHTLKLTFRPNVVFLYLLLFELIFATLYLADHFVWMQGIEAFDLDLEGTFSSWFSSSQLLLISLFCLAIHQTKHLHGKYYPQPIFLIASLAFLFLSIDETVQIHEKLSWKLVHLTHFIPSFKNGYGAWLLPYTLGLLALIIYVRQSLCILWKKHSYAFLLSVTGMAIFVTGGVLLEIISYQFLRDASHQHAYAIEVACEEFLEMFGSSVMLYGVSLMYHQAQA